MTLELLTGAKVIDLKMEEADLAIRSGPVLDQDLIARPLGESGWSLYASPVYLARRPAPVDPDDLSRHDIIGYDLTLSAVPAAMWIEQRMRGATLALRSREMTDMLLAAALRGAGLAVLQCLMGDDESGLVRLTPDVLATRQLSLLYPREALLAQPVKVVIQFVLDVMRENAAPIAGTPSSRGHRVLVRGHAARRLTFVGCRTSSQSGHQDMRAMGSREAWRPGLGPRRWPPRASTQRRLATMRA